MKNSIKPLFFAAFAALFAGSFAPATHAQMAQPPIVDRSPLAVIRFINPNVAFENALKTAIEKAESMKPGVVYTLVSTLPASQAQPLDDKTSAKIAAENGRVKAALVSYGVSDNRIMEKNGVSRSIRAHEVRIFVE